MLSRTFPLSVGSQPGDLPWAAAGEERAPDFVPFFTVDGELLPLPETACRFPLIVEGPLP
jgi:hypothetical protein